jgi:hypothetical protein
LLQYLRLYTLEKGFQYAWLLVLIIKATGAVRMRSMRRIKKGGNLLLSTPLQASLLVPLGAANATGRRKLEEGLKSLKAAGGTDILGGANLCLNQIIAMEPAAKARYQKAVLLITDGEQNGPR